MTLDKQAQEFAGLFGHREDERTVVADAEFSTGYAGGRFAKRDRSGVDRDRRLRERKRLVPGRFVERDPDCRLRDCLRNSGFEVGLGSA